MKGDISMKNLTKEQLAELVNSISKEVSDTYELENSTGNGVDDTIQILAGSMTQIQKNCMNIIIETLYKILYED